MIEPGLACARTSVTISAGTGVRPESGSTSHMTVCRSWSAR
ncbi:hypothetical protein ACIBI9_49255 [Nonomuraea sp. NPDC050451]